MVTTDFRKVIEELKDFNYVVKDCIKPVRSTGINPADKYDLRYIGKQESKKLTLNEIESLIEYGTEYIKQYDAGKFMTSKNKNGFEVADFEESEAYREIQTSLSFLNLEIRRRM